MTHTKADSTIAGFKDVLSEHVTTPSNQVKSFASSRDGNAPTVRFTNDGGESSFPYAYVQYIRFKGGIILLRTTTARIQIEGKNLRELYLQLERFKTDAVHPSPLETKDDGQPIVDAISITFDEEQPNERINQ